MVLSFEILLRRTWKKTAYKDVQLLHPSDLLSLRAAAKDLRELIGPMPHVLTRCLQTEHRMQSCALLLYAAKMLGLSERQSVKNKQWAFDVLQKTEWRL
eukprot:6200303-Karenia_brevis.AAC.1